MKPSRIIITAIVIFLFGIGGCASNATGNATKSKANVNTSKSASPTPTPFVAASPNGTYSGSCDYTLSTNFNNPGGTLIGEVDITNNGNIGTVTKAIITWPQEGYNSIKAVKTVNVKAGATKAVSFHVPANDTVISQLQSWQTGHNYKDGCTYRAVIMSTYGKVKS